MPQHHDRLLALMLALFVAYAPIGSAFAMAHVCNPVDDAMPQQVAGHAGHLQSTPVASADKHVSLSPERCTGCDSACCSGMNCSANACGSSGLAVMVVGPDSRINASIAKPYTAYQRGVLDQATAALLRPPRS